jgi:predicted nucleic acid-binding protein
MRVFVDTSALIALLDEDDQWHEAASAIFRSLAGTAELITHSYVHVEAIAVATRRLGRGAAERLTEAYLPIVTTIWVDEALHREALAAVRAGPAGRSSVSFVDRVSFALMRALGLEIAFAFDADFDAAGFTRASVPPETARRLSEGAAPYGASPDADSALVSVSEIAARTGHPVNTVQSWRRRHVDFPAPVVQLAAGPVWTWAPVKQWVDARDRSRSTRQP